METTKKEYPPEFEKFLIKFGVKGIWEYENVLDDREKLICKAEYFKWYKNK